MTGSLRHWAGSPWTAERVAELKRRWSAGENSRAIAKDFGMSKSAVCGKANRMGLWHPSGPGKANHAPLETMRKAVLHIANHSPLDLMKPHDIQARLRAIAGERHTHAASIGSDVCNICLRDLRDEVHLRAGETPEGGE